MSIQLTPFARVLCALMFALPVAAFVKTKYPTLFSRARKHACGRVTAQSGTAESGDSAEAAGMANRTPATREKREESTSTPSESFFERFITLWFQLAFTFEICVFMLTNLGYFALLNGKTTVGYDFAASMVVFALSIVLLFYKKYDKRVLAIGGALLAAVLLGILSCAARPYKPGVIVDFDSFVSGADVDFVRVKPSFAMYKTAFVIVRLVLSFSVAAKTFETRADKLKIFAALLWLCRVAVLYGFFEIVAKKCFERNLTELYYNRFFGETPHTFANINRFQGLYKEPSHYATYFSFFGFLTLLKLVGGKNKSLCGNVFTAIADNLFFFAIVFLLAYSTSFGAYLYVVLLLFMYFWFYASPKGKIFWVWGFLLLFAAAFLAVGVTPLKTKWQLEGVYERASSFFRSFFKLLKGDDATFTSEGARLTSAFFALKYFAARPLFGIGLSYVEANSTTLSLLASVGISGTALLASFYAAFARTSKKSAFFCVCVYFSMSTLGWLGFAFATVIPATFLFAELTLSGGKSCKAPTKTAQEFVQKENERI